MLKKILFPYKYTREKTVKGQAKDETRGSQNAM